MEAKSKPELNEADVLRKQVEELKAQLAARDGSDLESLKAQVSQLQAAMSSHQGTVDNLNSDQRETRRQIEELRAADRAHQDELLDAHRELASGPKKYFVTLQGQGRIGRCVGVDKNQNEANAQAKFLRGIGAIKTSNDFVCEEWDEDKHKAMLCKQQYVALYEQQKTAA